MTMIRWLVAAVSCLLMLSLAGCYYMQAIGGQMDVLRNRRSIAEVIADESTDEALREKLLLVTAARRFAVDELQLPDNGSYSSYADLQRDYVLWNVFAAPEFSLQPKLWCYPIAGCVAYRGYFSEDKAARFADKLERDGYDVMVGGVPAYSTLGRFEDPILNTMLNWSDRYLVETLFHELAHQKLYIKDDTGFNESFATAVAETGIERWLRAHGDTQDLESLARSRELLQQVRELVSTATTRLEALYASEVRMDEKRAQKARILAELRKGADDAIADSGLQVRNWLAEPLNNARLVSLGAYEGNLDAFRALLDDCAFELECFYAQAAELAQLQPVRRKQRLEALNERFVEAANADRSRSPPEKARPAQ